MTGQMPPNERKVNWKSKRVFFVTPQILANDIKRGTCPANAIACIVVDEAHRAQGNYAYCTVIQEIAAVTRYFRVLALSASPGISLFFFFISLLLHETKLKSLVIRCRHQSSAKCHCQFIDFTIGSSHGFRH